LRFLDNWQKIVHARNVEKGFYDYEQDIQAAEYALTEWHPDDTVAEDAILALRRIVADYKKAMRERKLLLIIGELCEAHEELRAGHQPHEIYHNGDNPKPEGYGIEMADAAIRTLDLMEADGLDLNSLMEAKHDYNGTRPYKHGKQF
jgi:hypothetical protein